MENQSSRMQSQLPTASAFKNAMRRFVSSVTIVTASDGSNKFGITASSITSVSADPPTILAIINQNASIHETIRNRARFCINLLGPEQEELSRAFSGRVDVANRFQIGNWEFRDDGLPVMIDAQCNLVCETSMSLGYTSHSIFIGEIREIMLGKTSMPLVYFDGTFWNNCERVS
jgi:flavin reductase